MRDNMKKFMREVNSNKALRNKLEMINGDCREKVTPEIREEAVYNVLLLAREYGFDLKPTDFVIRAADLGDDDMAEVAGGVLNMAGLFDGELELFELQEIKPLCEISGNQ